MPVSMAAAAAPASMGAPLMRRMRLGGASSAPPSPSPLRGRPPSFGVPEVERGQQEPPLDDAPYLARIRELSADVERSAVQRDARAFDLVVARLSELLEDMRSIGGFDELVSALDLVLSELRALLGRELTDASRLAQELLSLADRSPSRPAPQPPERAFWK